MDGIIPLDKPAGMSSARAVDVVKSFLPRGTKIGHAGTLDPFATGALVLLVGKATRLCEQLMDKPKQYLARAKFGATTPTDDVDSEPKGHEVREIPTLGQVDRAMEPFTGEIQQVPPQYSALKVKGKPAYERAREGETVPLVARTVRVHQIERIGYAWPYLSFKIDCGRGTYIRSLARDLGEALGVGGHLIGLRRIFVGPFGSRYPLVGFEHLARHGLDHEALLPLAAAD